MTHTIDKKAKLARDSTLRKLASWTSLVVAVVLVALKFAAWLATGSIALLSSAIDALVDTASSLVTFAGGGVGLAERAGCARFANPSCWRLNLRRVSF